MVSNFELNGQNMPPGPLSHNQKRNLHPHQKLSQTYKICEQFRREFGVKELLTSTFFAVWGKLI